jgi:phosphonatase-like hydrolase
MNLPQLVVFDMAGTTVEDGDGAVNRCLRDALAAQGFPVEHAEVNAVMGIPKPDAIRQLLSPRIPDGDTVAELTPKIHADFLQRMLRFYQEDPSVVPVAGAEEAFAKLRAAGVVVTLDTGFSRDIADTVLDRFGWERDGKIDGSVTSDEVERGRPHPDLVLALMERFGITDAERVAKVGDTPSDLEQGTSAGCGWVIGVTQGSHTADQLNPYPHTHLVPTVASVPALLGLE